VGIMGKYKGQIYGSVSQSHYYCAVSNGDDEEDDYLM
jgi:hypothetical protein